MRAKKLIASLVSSLLLLNPVNTMTAFAEVALPEGAVKGLPEKLTAMDSDGNVVSSDTGEYFFHVENMQYGTTYTKDVQLMNLRDDKSYHIYFYIEPFFKSGGIDLEKGCDCTFWLDGQEFYKGTVTGLWISTVNTYLWARRIPATLKARSSSNGSSMPLWMRTIYLRIPVCWE